MSRLLNLGSKRIDTALLPLTWVLLLPLASQAATVDLNWGVSVGNQGTTTIAPGDTVRWTWVDTVTHSVNSVDDGFTSSSIVAGLGTQYEVVFNTPGSFPYNCDVHAAMQGVISVVAPVPMLSPAVLWVLGAALGAGAVFALCRRTRQSSAEFPARS